MSTLRSTLINRIQVQASHRVFGSKLAEEINTHRKNPTEHLRELVGYKNGEYNVVAPFLFPEDKTGNEKFLFANPILPRVSANYTFF